MTKLHDENFYFYQNDLLDEKDFPDLENAKPITRAPDEPGGPSPWSGGLALTRGGGFRMRPIGDGRDLAEPPRRPDIQLLWDPPSPSVSLKEGAGHWLEAVRSWQRGLDELQRRRHDSAAFLFDQSQQFAIGYFNVVRKIPVIGADVRARVSNILSKVASGLDPNPQPPPGPLAQGPRTLRRMLELRRGATTLASLHNLDWVAPVTAAANVRERPGIPVSRLNANAIEVLQHIAAPQAGIDAKLQNHFYLVHQKLDYFMIATSLYGDGLLD